MSIWRSLTLRLFIGTVTLFWLAATPDALAGTYYVSPQGADSAPGTLDRPFRTLQKAAGVLQPGDTCCVRAGTYRESVALTRSGTEGKPIRFAAYPGEIVLLRGTDPLECRWQKHEGHIYKTAIARVFDQLFVDDEMMVEARWPNRPMEKLWDRSTWASAVRGSCYGRLRDPQLVKTGVDFTGALAVLNVTHQFYTWTRFVTDHEPRRDYFEYPKDFGKSTEMRYGTKTWAWQDDRYYLAGVLAALDQPGEWHLDREAKVLYLWPKDGRDPTGRRIEAKARDYAFTGTRVSHVRLEGFHFFGATFRFITSHHCVVEGCHLLFPSYTRELVELNAKPTRANSPGTLMAGDYNIVRNCSIAYSPTSGIGMAGRQTLVENCLVHDVCWNGSLRYPGIRMARGRRSAAPPGGAVRHCTAYNCGNAIISFGGHPVDVAFNHVHDGGLACKDVAMIYTGGPQCAGSVVRYNWAYGCRTEEGAGLGIRGDDQTRTLTAHHNVVWDCGRDGIIVKGDFNQVHNNTTLFMGHVNRLGNFIAMPMRPEPVKPWRRQFPLLKVQNANSRIYNNVARTVVSNQSKRTPYPPGDNLANTYSEADPGLVDSANWDFRPRADSPVVDAGRVVPGFTDGFKAAAPDIGAYEYSGEHWLPGHHNGLWVSRSERAGRGDEWACRVALAMPPLETVSLRVAAKSGNVRLMSGQRLTFTRKDWMQPRRVAFTAEAGGRHPLAVSTPQWGEVVVDPSRAAMPDGLKVWFGKPDLGRPTPLDTRFNKPFEPPRPLAVALKPMARAFRASRPPRTDGAVKRSEWPGWTPERALRLRPLGGDHTRTDCAGEALVLFDEEHLYVAAKVRVPDETKLLRSGGSWGQTDGIEVDFQPIVGGKHGPVFVLHGFPSGQGESVTDGGASPDQAAALGRAVEFAAGVGRKEWTAEWRIPLAAAGIDLNKLSTIRFNVGARVAGEWFAWAGTRGPNYAVERAGELALLPACAASAKNLLQHGGFESAATKPWFRSSNKGAKFKGKEPIQRVQEAADAGWCMRFDGADPAVMKDDIAKWLHPLPKGLKPGTYVLSYDVRVEGLKPQGRGGMFCAYIRTAGDKAGRNEGQTEHRIVADRVPWTRHDCVISIPPGFRLSFVSLQLHKATGTVWVDNVALWRCE